MKSIFRYIIFAAVALSAVLAACSKDTVVESNPGTAEGNQGLRTIILQFSPDTKAAFNGTKAEFQNGDVIKVANATQSEDATVQVSGGIASITTSLTGNLTAVFPSTAANVSGNGPLEDPQFKVKAQQNGTSGDAVIAMARIEGKNAVFELKTALFEITPPSTAKKIIIKSLKPVESGVARTGTAAEINTEGTDKTVITVGDGSANLPNPIYVALFPGVNLTDLSFDAGEAVGMKGIPENKLGTTPNATVARGKYTIDNSNWHPYVTIGGLKWATMDIGATSPTGKGEFFAWGDINGQAGTTFSHQYDWANAPFNNSNTAYNSTYFSSVKSNECPGNILALKNDAAYANWGGAWRIPVKAELENLSNGTKSFNTSTRIWTFGTELNQIQKLTYGYGSNSLSVMEVNNAGSFWSSTLGDSNDKAFRFCGDNTSTCGVKEDGRQIGHPIRPVADL